MTAVATSPFPVRGRLLFLTACPRYRLVISTRNTFLNLRSGRLFFLATREEDRKQDPAPSKRTMPATNTIFLCGENLSPGLQLCQYCLLGGGIGGGSVTLRTLLRPQPGQEPEPLNQFLHPLIRLCHQILHQNRESEEDHRLKGG